MTAFIASILLSPLQTHPPHWVAIISNATRERADAILGKPKEVIKTGDQSEFVHFKFLDFEDVSIDFYKGKSVNITIEFKKAPAVWNAAFSALHLETEGASAKEFELRGTNHWANISNIDGFPAHWKARFNPAHTRYSDTGPVPTRAMLAFYDPSQVPRTETN